MESQLSDVLATAPALEQICRSLTFPELAQLWIANNRQDIPCNVEVEDVDRQTYILNGINAETVAVYPYLLKHDEYEDDGLLNAIYDINIPAIFGFLKLGWNLNREYTWDSENRITPMQTAALTGNIPLLKILIEHGGKLIPDRFDNDPLKMAIQGGHVNMVKFLLEQGIPANYIFDNYSLFDVAAGFDVIDGFSRDYGPTESIEIMKLLISFGGDPNGIEIDDDTEYRGNPVMSVLTSERFGQEQLELLEFVLEIGANPNIRDNRLYTETNKYPLTAVFDGKIYEAVEMLLKAGADPNLPEINKPLFLAATSKHIPSVVSLLKYKADPNVIFATGHSLLSVVIDIGRRMGSQTNDYWIIADLLLEAGANPNHRTGNFSAFHEALQFAPNYLIRSMLKKKADPNVFFHEYPLQIATRLGKIEIIFDLLNAGANPNINYRERSGLLLSYWIKKDDLMIVKSLLEHGADLSKIPEAIFLAVKLGDLDMVKLLVENGANLNPPITIDNQTLTLTQYLDTNPRPSITEYLTELLPK